VPLFSHSWLQTLTGLPPQQGLRLKGPALNIEISVSDNVALVLENEGKQIPQPQVSTAFIDTGASLTVVEESVLVGLGLIPVNTIPITTPGGNNYRKVYACKMSFPGTLIPALSPIQVVGCELGGFGHTGLIGRDILSKFLLVYNGVEGHWTLAF